MTKKRSAEIGTLLCVFRHSLPFLRVSTFVPRNGVDTVYRISDRLLTADYFAIPLVETATDIRRNPLPSISPPG